MLKIKTPAEDMQKELYQILCDMDYRNELLAVRRTYILERVFADYPQYSPDTYYRYIPMAGIEKNLVYSVADCSAEEGTVDAVSAGTL